MMSLGLCMCDYCESEEKRMRKYSKKVLSQKSTHNCKTCYVENLQQKKISSEMKTRETFYN